MTINIIVSKTNNNIVIVRYTLTASKQRSSSMVNAQSCAM